jgi:metal-sulfur cluster biosynthetic enzyme
MNAMPDTETSVQRPTTEELWEALKVVQDPELHMGIVDLGLVYAVEIDEAGLVSIDLTLTSPGCPIGPMIQGQAYHLLTQIEGVEDVEVNLVWDPPWDPRTMASDEVKMMLGIW